MDIHEFQRLEEAKAFHLPMEGFTGDIQYLGRLALVPSILVKDLQDCSLLQFLSIVAEISHDWGFLHVLCLFMELMVISHIVERGLFIILYFL
jgi:hypothetical protein